MNMKVYVVKIDWHNDQPKIKEIFDTREKAKNYFRQLLKESLDKEDLNYFSNDNDYSFEDCVNEGVYENSWNSDFMYIAEYDVK